MTWLSFYLSGRCAHEVLILWQLDIVQEENDGLLAKVMPFFSRLILWCNCLSLQVYQKLILR